jgi:hypothetical protein
MLTPRRTGLTYQIHVNPINTNVWKVLFYHLSQLKAIHSGQTDVHKDEMRWSRIDLLEDFVTVFRLVDDC